MVSIPAARTAGQVVIDFLLSRKAFDYYWEEIHPETQQEIIAEIDKLVKLRKA